MTASRKVARVDIAVAVLYAGVFECLLHASSEVAADAVGRYGHNVDSGALEFIAAIFYFAPVTFLLASAALCLWRGWRVRCYVHWIAVAGAVVPLFIPAVIFVAR